MTSARVVIRYSFTESKEDNKRTTAIINASIPGATHESALNYLIKKYPERHKIEVYEVTFQYS